MDLSYGGYASTVDAGKRLVEACRRSQQFSIQAYVTPDTTNTDDYATLVACSSDSSAGNFTLSQIHDQLVFTVRTSQTEERSVKLLQIKENKGVHVIVSCSEHTLNCYVDGATVKTTKEVNISFASWKENPIFFGASMGGTNSWSGKLEGVAVYSSATTPKQAGEAYSLFAKRLADRQPLDTILVEAELVSLPAIPDPKAILPYVRAIAESKFQVKRVISGELEQKEIAVASWVILDSKRLDNLPKTGSILRLQLQPHDGHPQLKSEQTTLDDNNLSLDLYYDCRPMNKIPIVQ